MILGASLTSATAELTCEHCNGGHFVEHLTWKDYFWCRTRSYLANK